MFCAICLGTLTAAWAVLVHILSRSGALRIDRNESRRIQFGFYSLTASAVCLFVFLQVPDWRLMWVRWQHHDFCALPGHAALYWIFVRDAPFAFFAPVFAYIASRLATTLGSKILCLIILGASINVLALAIHGLYWSRFW
jgi:hypothetical protein